MYRWDLDKTYLDTDFESVRGLVRSAVESARSKRAIPGATALLRELARERAGWRPRVVLLSGSPKQMRTVLEQKLRMDGVRWDEFVLKDTLGSLRRGRFRAVKDQFGYKLPQLLNGRIGLGPAVGEVLFGDDAEADALIYSLYADVVAGRVSPNELSRVMEAAGAYADAIVAALASARQLARAEAVQRIFIRLDKGALRWDMEPLMPRVVPVRSWFEAAMVLGCMSEISAEGLARVHDGGTWSASAIREGLEGLLQRRLVSGEGVRRVGEDLGAHGLAAVFRELGATHAEVTVRAQPTVDYLELVRSRR